MVEGEARATSSHNLESIENIMHGQPLTLSIDIDVLVEEAIMWTGARIKVEHYYPPWLIEDNELVRNILSITRYVNSMAKVGVWRFSTDDVYSAGEAHIPTIGIGPGNEELAHKPNEFVEIEQLLMASKIYSELVKKFFTK